MQPANMPPSSDVTSPPLFWLDEKMQDALPLGTRAKGKGQCILQALTMLEERWACHVRAWRQEQYRMGMLPAS